MKSFPALKCRPVSQLVPPLTINLKTTLFDAPWISKTYKKNNTIMNRNNIFMQKVRLTAYNGQIWQRLRSVKLMQKRAKGLKAPSAALFFALTLP